MGVIGSYYFDNYPYEEAKQMFMSSIEYFIKSNKLRLAKNEYIHDNSTILTSNITEQLVFFENALPDKVTMQEKKDYWWYTDECPIIPVWIIDEEVEGFTTKTEDGQYYFWA